jgi:hypothetical protein
MWRFLVSKMVLLVLFPCFAIALASAVTPNPKLLSLVPPTARMVAGMNAPQRGGQPDAFLLITHNNQMDLNDFLALTGVDGSRAIDQVVMVASEGNGGAYAAHSLMAIGHFDQALIYKSAQGAGATAIQYRKAAVLELQPLARERDRFHDVRWLAVMDSKLAVLGTITMVQQELDRYLDHVAAEPSLERKLGHLRHNYSTWCVATLPHDNSEIQEAFKMLDSRLAELLQAGDTLEFGMHYGRQVEFEYEVGMASSPDPEVVSRMIQSSTVPHPKAAFALPAAELTRFDGGVRGVLKISRARYEAWTAGVQGAKSELSAAAHPSKR